MPKWPKIPPKQDLLNADHKFKKSASNNVGKKILVDYDVQPNSQHVLQENVIIVASRLLEIDNAENKGADQVQVKNFWRFNQPVDSGDTRSLLDLQTKRKRRNANVIYIESPLVAILSGKHPNQGTNLEPVQQRKVGSPKSGSSGEKSKVDNQSVFKEKLYPSKLKTILKVPDPGQSNSKSSSLLKRLQSSSSSLSSSSLTTSQSKVSALRFNLNTRPTTLNDIFISVKTTEKFHESRLKILLDTWFQYAKEQTYFFTDTNDEKLNKKTNNHMINTNCSALHNRQALCCKMAQEYDTFMESKKRWFCHVDDDTYVNVPKLVTLLQKYNHTQDWYLGKLSLKHPLQIMDINQPGKKIEFWFATGGAGFCISRSLALKMMPHAGGGRLMAVGEEIRLPDDCTVGYIIGHLLKKPLTEVEDFHSHLEALWLLRPNQLEKHVTFSYSYYGEKMNIVNVPGFSEDEDPTRLWSLHCYLFPYLKKCRDIKQSVANFKTYH
ncbi:beta-1,3-N-acetylglucosaminyltransferase radical fringe-like [Octopus vulgaris]|uniref:Beta-1,3-N-acetylglucosaminyltransferase radical fringe-like n=1 Tax=Octopus vulgaris TaxID=6645 RepID=A0AA36B6D3_OCTVU|nr:beta-1,3-N-acetylglucosaminyltransferase radical fringe-like [Octopus vulgaris]